MSWEYVNFDYPVPNLFEKHLVWLSTNCHVYFAMRLNDSDNWTYYAGNASHNLLSGKILTSYGSNETSAQTNYLLTNKDSNNKVLAILPTVIQARYIRMYIESGSSVTVYEWIPSTKLTAHEIITGDLEITDELSESPKITITSSSIERLKIGNISGSTYGIVGYDSTSATVFELSDANQTIAGLNITNTLLQNGNDIVIDSSNKRISINSSVFGNSGVQFDYNSGTPRAYIGNGSNQYFNFDGTNISWKGVNTELSTSGKLTVSDIEVTGGAVAGNTVTSGINANNITTGTLNASIIGANIIEASNIAANSITATEIAANTITSNEIAANTITATEIKSDTITSNEIAANTITSDEIAANTITATEIKSDTITSNEIAANTITSDEIKANTITGNNINANFNISGKTITTDTGTIGGWTLSATTIESDTTGSKIVLNKSKNRISIYSYNTEKVVIGYLNGLTKNASPSQQWGPDDYGFYALSGNHLKIDGNASYVSGDWIIEHDAAYKVVDGNNNVIIKMGTDSGKKGMFIYSSLGTQLAEYSNSGITVGDVSSSQYMKYTTADGAVFSGNITILGGSGISLLSDAGALVTVDDLDGVPDGTSYGKVAKTAISAGKIILTSGTGVDGILPETHTEADVTSQNKSIGILTKDTRNDNEPPSFYYSKGKGIYSEFKYRSVIDAPGSATYGLLKTSVPWHDTTGGLITQQFYEGANSYKRYSSGSSSWTNWAIVYDGADVTADNPQSVSWLTDAGALATKNAVDLATSEVTNKVLDNIADGATYARVLKNDISSGHIILSACTGNLDDIDDGTTYGKVKSTAISAGLILLSEASGDLDDIVDGTSYGKVAKTAISAGKIILTSGTGVDGILPETHTEADVSPGLPSDENLVGYWAFDDGSGTVAIDSSGNRNDGTLVNMEDADWVDGVSGKCLSFDGTDEYVDIPYGSGIDPSTSPHSFSAWVKSNNASSGCIFLSTGQDTNDRMYIGHDSGYWKAGIQDDSWGLNSGVTATTNLTHIVLIMDGSNAKMYINGEYKNQISYTSYTFNRNIDIGHHAGSGFWWNGLIDEVRIYNRALTADEVKALYLYPAGNKQNVAVKIFDQGALATKDDVAEGDLQSAVLNRMFLDAETKANIEAWRKAGSPTYLDGEKIYAQSITADKFISTLYGDMNQAMNYVKTVLGAGDEYEHDLTDTDLSNGSETNIDADTHVDYGVSVRISTAKEWDDGGVWDSGTWDEPTDSSGSWTSASMDLGSLQTLQIALSYIRVEENPASTTETIKFQYSTDNTNFGTNSPAFDNGLWETAPINQITGNIYKATGTLKTFRYFKVKIELETTVTTDKIILHMMMYQGNVINLFGMESNKAIASGGTTIDLSGFNTTPAITVTPVGSTPLVPLITAQSSSSVTVKLYNLSGSAVSGYANITIIGV